MPLPKGKDLQLIGVPTRVVESGDDNVTISIRWDKVLVDGVLKGLTNVKSKIVLNGDGAEDNLLYYTGSANLKENGVLVASGKIVQALALAIPPAPPEAKGVGGPIKWAEDNFGSFQIGATRKSANMQVKLIA